MAFGAFLWADLHRRWSMAGGTVARRLVPLVTTAAVVGVATHGPFGEPERAWAGRPGRARTSS